MKALKITLIFEFNSMEIEPSLPRVEEVNWEEIADNDIALMGLMLRASPQSALYKLASGRLDAPAVIMTTAGAAIQRVPAKDTVLERVWGATSGSVAELDQVVQWLSANGFQLAIAGRTCWNENEDDARKG